MEVSGVRVGVQSLFELGQGQVDGRRNRPKSDLVRLPHVHQKDILYRRSATAVARPAVKHKTHISRLLGNGLQLLVSDDGVLGPLRGLAVCSVIPGLGDDHPERLGGGEGPFGGEGSSESSRGGEGAEGALGESTSEGHDGVIYSNLLMKKCSAGGGLNDEYGPRFPKMPSTSYWSGLAGADGIRKWAGRL